MVYGLWSMVSCERHSTYSFDTVDSKTQPNKSDQSIINMHDNISTLGSTESGYIGA